jgi:hypothetical protein
MGAVTVTGGLDPSFDIGLTGTLTIDSLDYNSAASGFSRLSWGRAFDLDGDGQFDDVIALSALQIDLAGSLEFAVAGSVTGLALTAGPVSISGATEFALRRQTVDVDSDGNGAADLIGATVDALALTNSNVSVVVTGVATLGVTGDLALARVTPAGQVAARYTALKMGAVTVTGGLDPSFDIGLTGTLTIDSLDYNSAASGFSRLSWGRAFDRMGMGSSMMC